MRLVSWKASQDVADHGVTNLEEIVTFHDPGHGQAQALRQASELLTTPDTPWRWQQCYPG